MAFRTRFRAPGPPFPALRRAGQGISPDSVTNPSSTRGIRWRRIPPSEGPRVPLSDGSIGLRWGRVRAFRIGVAMCGECVRSRIGPRAIRRLSVDGAAGFDGEWACAGAAAAPDPVRYSLPAAGIGARRVQRDDGNHGCLQRQPGGRAAVQRRQGAADTASGVAAAAERHRAGGGVHERGGFCRDVGAGRYVLDQDALGHRIGRDRATGRDRTALLRHDAGKRHRCVVRAAGDQARLLPGRDQFLDRRHRRDVAGETPELHRRPAARCRDPRCCRPRLRR